MIIAAAPDVEKIIKEIASTTLLPGLIADLNAVRVYIGLGSNLDDPVAQLEKALVSIRSLANDGELDVSSFYKTAPVGPQDQPDFVNAVAGFLTQLPASELLQALQKIEASQGRQRGEVQWGPRTLDLDLLLYGNESIITDVLIVPHPRIKERAFVMVPLREIAADIVIPGQGDLRLLLQGICQEKVMKINVNS